MKNRTVLNLGEVVSISIIYHIPDSWLNLWNDCEFYFRWRDSENQQSRTLVTLVEFLSLVLKKLPIFLFLPSNLLYQIYIQIKQLTVKRYNMGDIGLSIYSKFMRLKSSREVHYNFSLVHDQIFLFQRSIRHRMWEERWPFKVLLIVFVNRLW